MSACLCGCGAECARRFLPGHDAKLHGLAVRVSKGEAQRSELPRGEEARAWLLAAPWMTPEMKKACGLGGRRKPNTQK